MKPFLRAWLQRLGNVGKPDDSDIADELESNLQLHIDDNVRRGMNPADARRDAIIKLGGIEPAKESYRDQRSVRWMDNLLHDTRYTLRQLRNNPGFTITALLILTLGMASSASIFAFVHAVLLKPLPYQDPTRLAGVFETAPSCPLCNLSHPDFIDWKAQTQTLSQLEGYTFAGFAMPTKEGVQVARGARVSAGFFRLLGVQPVLGRNFIDGEDKPGSPLLVILTQEAWQKWFSGDPTVIGRRLTLNDKPNEVVGVLPNGFHFAPLGTPEFYQIQVPSGGCETRRSCHGMYGVGRMKAGIGIEAVRSEMSEIASRLEKQYPSSNREQGGTAELLSDVVNGKMRPIVLTLFGGVCLLLLIVWANIASLLLVRSEGRRRELAVRRALGASGLRLATQFLTEGIVLVALSSLAGLLLTSWLIRALVSMIPDFMLEQMPYLEGLELNSAVLWFAAAVAATAVIIVAVTPALHLLFVKTGEGLAEGSRGSAGLSWRRMGAKLVTFELATAAVLLVGAGLLGKSLFLMLQVDLGFNPDRLLAIRLDLPPSVYDKNEKIEAFQRELRRQLQTLPGVSAVAYSSQLLITHTGNTTWLHLFGTSNDGVKIDLPERAVSPEYFSTIGARLAGGRYFSETDNAAHDKVVIVNRLFAERFFPGQNAVGKRVVYHREGSKPMEIVGLVENLREGQLDGEERPVLYVPFQQQPDTSMVLTVRTTNISEPLIPLVTAKVRDQHRDILMDQPRTMATRIDNSSSAYVRRSSAWLVGGFAGLALLLSVIGLYGVVAYSVSQRTREIGVRMALGAEQTSVSNLILKEAGWLCIAGLAVGLAGAVALASVAEKMLFGVKSWDFVTLAAVAVVLGGAALLASYIPARRAASVNPIEALRAE